MKKEALLLTICSLISFTSLFAQPYKSLQEFYTDFYMEKVRTTSSAMTYTDITGNPYLDNEFKEGTILMKNQKKYAIPLRFNLYENNFEFIVDSTVITIGNPNNIIKIQLDNCTYVYYHLNNRNSFVELIVSGKYNLVCQKEVILRKAEPAGAYKEPKPASFLRKPDQYYIVNEKNEQFLVKNKKSLINIFDNKKEEITKFIKKEKISHKKKADLKKLVEHCNAL